MPVRQVCRSLNRAQRRVCADAGLDRVAIPVAGDSTRPVAPPNEKSKWARPMATSSGHVQASPYAPAPSAQHRSTGQRREDVEPAQRSLLSKELEAAADIVEWENQQLVHEVSPDQYTQPAPASTCTTHRTTNIVSAREALQRELADELVAAAEVARWEAEQERQRAIAAEMAAAAEIAVWDGEDASAEDAIAANIAPPASDAKLRDRICPAGRLSGVDMTDTVNQHVERAHLTTRRGACLVQNSIATRCQRLSRSTRTTTTMTTKPRRTSSFCARTHRPYKHSSVTLQRRRLRLETHTIILSLHRTQS